MSLNERFLSVRHSTFPKNNANGITKTFAPWKRFQTFEQLIEP